MDKHKSKIEQGHTEHRATKEHDQRALVDVQFDISTQFDAVRRDIQFNQKSNVKKQSDLDIKESNTERGREDLHLNRKRKSNIQQRENIHTSTRGLDEYRATITRSTRGSDREEQELIKECKKHRERIHEQYEEFSRELREECKKTTARIHKALEGHNGKAGQTQSECVDRAKSTTATQRECLDRAKSTTATKQRIRKTIESIKDGFIGFISNLKDKAKGFMSM